MENNDTIELLKECNAGIKMGVTTIEETIDYIKNSEFKNILNNCKEEHQKLGSETHELLNKYGEAGKEPNIMAKGMSWFKTNFIVSISDDDGKAADLITDGCNMGVKSLNKYLNKYESADDKSKYIAKRLIDIEHQLAIDIRKYL